MSIRNLDSIFKPKSVALIGASDHPGALGAVTLRNLARAGLKGPLYLINPKHRTLEGMDVYPDVQSLPAAPDLAVIATPPETVPGLVADLGQRGTKGAVIITAGFGELGEHGHELQRRTLEAARPHLLRIIGPNCLGVMVPGSGLDASFSHLPPVKGDLAFVSQSGALITAMLDWAYPRGVGFSHVVSLGDMSDVDFGDTIDYLAADTGTRAILLYIEGIRNARKFMSAARAAARTKPVLVVKVGRFAEGARAARSHTGAMAGADAVYEAAFRRAGMLRVNTMAELFDAVETLALTGQQQGNRLAVLTNGGGPGVLATDALIGMGGKLATLSDETVAKLDKLLPATWSRGNPVDIIGDAPGARYADALAALLADPNVDATLVLNCPTALGAPMEAAQAVIDTLARNRADGSATNKNVFTSWLGEHSALPARRLFAEARVASYDTPDDAVLGFMHRVRYRQNQELLMQTPELRSGDFEPDAELARRTIDQAIADGRHWLDSAEVAAVLAAYGIPTAASRNVTTPEEAAAAAEAIGKPVVLKIRSPDITHKSDVGGVALNLLTPSRVNAVAVAMLSRLHKSHPDARLDGFLVQEMVQRLGAVELIVGLVDDRVFGPVVLFGHGGTAVELLADSTLELPPLNLAVARAQMARTRVWRLLQGYRGKPPADIDAIAKVLIGVGQIATNHPEIVELDINPLLADAEGVVAVDARIGVAKVSETVRDRLAISPYPAEFAGTGMLPDGVKVHLQPVQPEDEARLQDIVAHMSAEDIRLRFLAPMKHLPHKLAARLSQIDYDREMALIAFREGDDTALGVAQFAADPDNRRAEFAIALRSDWKGRGLGYLLLQRLMEIAAKRGVGEMFGIVERDNEAMLDVCRSLGFTASADLGNFDLLRVSKTLGAAAAQSADAGKLVAGQHVERTGAPDGAELNRAQLR